MIFLSDRRNITGPIQRYYIEVLKNYATYLLNYKNDSKSAIKYFSECNDYLLRHREDASLRDQVFEGYATGSSS